MMGVQRGGMFQRLKRTYVCFSILWVVWALALSHAQAEEFGKACRESPKLVGACFTVRGRLVIAMGGWQLRLWPVGTKRILAVVDPNGIWDDTTMQPNGAPYLPPDVSDALEDLTAVYANYTLCPITPDVPGEMRHVCMVDAKNIFVEHAEICESGWFFNGQCILIK